MNKYLYYIFKHTSINIIHVGERKNSAKFTMEMDLEGNVISKINYANTWYHLYVEFKLNVKFMERRKMVIMY